MDDVPPESPVRMALAFGLVLGIAAALVLLTEESSFRSFAAAACIASGLWAILRDRESPPPPFEPVHEEATTAQLDHRLGGLGLILLGANLLWPRRWMDLVGFTLVVWSIRPSFSLSELIPDEWKRT